jgi:Protein of unknown function (DUF669)
MTQSTYLENAFETEKEEGTPAFELLPRDRYTAEVFDAKAGPTKNGKGYAVTLTWRISEGEYEGRTVFQYVLLQHDNSDAMKWGRQRFKDILTALGITGDVSDLTTLYNIPATISVIQKEDKTGQYAPKNEINRVLPLVTRPFAPIFKKDDPISSGPAGAGMNDQIPF